ncbi:MAG: DegT/DnrJ/EryC1/StrS family aminotransferase [Erysipelotrichaceae bacterium]|nr:DegT/DnrJ/EryC1/StrS family aminotransferase [Erysipelotrichaceae bacterium]
MNRKIPVIKSSLPSFEEFIEEIKPIWESRWLTNMGAKHNELESKLQDFLGVKHVSLVVNGHQGLEIALQTLGLKGEVITTPYTFASTTHAIVRCGLKPVFCDINPYDYTMDVDKIEELITDKTCAIMPVHVYGNICDVERIEEIAKKHNLKVIYDAAHAFGETYKGKGVLNYGDISMLSFHATKVYHTIEGGALCYNDDALVQPLFLMRDFGIKDEETVEIAGTNTKMNEFCAAMGLCNLRHFDETIAKRKKLVELYRELLKDLPGVKLNPINPDTTENYCYFPVVIQKENAGYTRDEIFEFLKANGVFARKYFYPLITDFDCYKNEYDSNLTPVAKEISNSVMTLPLYDDLTGDDVRYICSLFAQWKDKSK